MRPKTTFKKELWILGLIILLAFAAVVYFSLTAPTEKIRVGIMPMTTTETSGPFTNNTLALQLVERLSNLTQGNLEIIGPTTTANFDMDKIWEEVDAHNLDVLINGRFMNVNYRSTVLMEVIRASDGAHIWVQSFDGSTDPEVILTQVQKGLLGSLGE